MGILLCDGWVRRRWKLGYSGASLYPFTKTLQKTPNSGYTGEMVSAVDGSWVSPISHFFFPRRFMSWLVSLWEAPQNAVGSSKLHHLQAPGCWWWKWNLFWIHCCWTLLWPQMQNCLCRRSAVQELSLVFIETNLRCLKYSHWCCKWW